MPGRHMEGKSELLPVQIKQEPGTGNVNQSGCDPEITKIKQEPADENQFESGPEMVFVYNTNFDKIGEISTNNEPDLIYSLVQQSGPNTEPEFIYSITQNGLDRSPETEQGQYNPRDNDKAVSNSDGNDTWPGFMFNIKQEPCEMNNVLHSQILTSNANHESDNGQDTMEAGFIISVKQEPCDQLCTVNDVRSLGLEPYTESLFNVTQQQSDVNDYSQEKVEEIKQDRGGEMVRYDGPRLEACDEMVPNDSPRLEACDEMVPSDGPRLEACGEMVPNDGPRLEACDEMVPSYGPRLEACGEMVPSDGPTLPYTHLKEDHNAKHMLRNKPEFEYYIKKEPIDYKDTESSYDHGDSAVKYTNTLSDGPNLRLEYNASTIAEKMLHLDEDNDSKFLSHKIRNSCCICGQHFACKRHLLVHQQSHVSVNTCTFTCTICWKSFSEQSHLTMHQRIHTLERPFKCNVCEKGFVSLSQLGIHERIHTGEKPFKCGECGKRFRIKTHLSRHEITHTTNNPYKCDVCGKEFANTDGHSFTSHWETDHPGEKPYKCDVCGKEFIKIATFIKHHKMHTIRREKTCKCEICGKGFVGNDALSIHIKIHSGDLPYKCVVCGKGFANSGILTSHIRIHTGEKPYTCAVCGKSYKTKNHYNYHQSTHISQKLYTCEVCGKEFDTCDGTAMSDHWSAEHHGEKPYKCDVCGQEFIQISNFIIHNKMHRNYCSVCRQGFRTKSQLKTHQKMHTESCEGKHKSLKRKQKDTAVSTCKMNLRSPKV